MTAAIKLALFSSGVFFLVGLLTGIWKFRAMTTRPSHKAPVYVDTAHRASLLYSFAALLLARFVEFSPFPTWVSVSAVAAPLAFFASAIATYLWLGFREETDNQFERRTHGNTWGMWLLIAGEVGGFAVLFYGFAKTQLF
jgi:hypothetical protein